MEINGIVLDGLAHDSKEVVFPDPIKGRIVHIDADFLAYQCSAERVDGPEKSFEDMKHNAGIAVTSLRLLAGATGMHLHLTPSTSDKGGRYTFAVQKEYQGNRHDKAKPRYLHIMRDWLSSAYPSTQWFHAEADDGMSSEQYKALALGHKDLSVIATKDKDLNMVPGLHLHWDTGIVHDADNFGSVTLRARPSGAKVLDGYGQKFFWAQLLAGDTADNIQGLPKFYQAGKFKPCGPILTHQWLDTCKSHYDCFELLKTKFREYGDVFGYKHWKTGEEVAWQNVLISEMKLLWMRRNPDDQDDVLHWLRKEIRI